jgi:transposase-like protein
MGTAVVRYSESFKLQVVRELESGDLANQAEAHRRYGITGSATVARWIRKYGSPSLQRKVVYVQTPDEKSRLKALEREIRDLKRALVDSKVQEALHKAYFDIVCKEAGIADPAALKKSIAERLSKER